MFWRPVSVFLLSILAFAIPFEHKYDKLFRFFSLKLIPQDIVLPSFFENKIYFYPSDVIAIALLGLALFGLRIPMRRLFADRNASFLWTIFLLSLFSILISPLAHYPIPYFRLIQLFTPFLLFSFVANVFANEEKLKITSILFRAVILTASLQSCVAIAQYLTQDSLGLRLFSEPNHFASIGVVSGKRWIFDAPTIGNFITVIRPSGTFPHANVLGGFISISLLALYSFFSLPQWRFFAALVFPLQFFAMMLTYSRSALFSWIIGTLIWFFFQIRKNGFKTTWRDPSIRLLSVSVCAALFFTSVVLHEQIVQRGGIVNYSNLAKDSDALRIRYQNVAFQIIKDHPFFGAGFNQLSIRSLDYVKNDPQYEAQGGTHNIYFYLAAETGLISLTVFLFFLFSLLRAAYKAPYNHYLPSLTAMFVAFLFIGGCDFYPLLFQQGKLPFFLITGLLAAHVRLKQPLQLETA